MLPDEQEDPRPLVLEVRSNHCVTTYRQKLATALTRSDGVRLPAHVGEREALEHMQLRVLGVRPELRLEC